jgi:DNA-binding transcriptional LysR family regulator
MPAAIEAAVAGRGVMLGLHPIVWDVAAARALTNPFAGPLLSAGAYYVVHRKADKSRRTVTAFVDWITAEMRKDLRRLRAR